MQEIVVNNEVNVRSYPEEMTLALARVQGHWNKKSKELLIQNSKTDDMTDDDMTVAEQAIIGLVRFAVRRLVGDESVAFMILGRSVALSERERGLIVLSETVLSGATSSYREWQISSILAEAITHGGTSFDGIVKNLDKRFSGFLSSVIHLPDVESSDEVKGKNGEIIEDLKDLYGGSSIMLLQKQQELEDGIVGDLTRRVGGMSVEKLNDIISGLKGGERGEDVMVSSSMVSAKNILIEILGERRAALTEVLNSF